MCRIVFVYLCGIGIKCEHEQTISRLSHAHIVFIPLIAFFLHISPDSFRLFLLFFFFIITIICMRTFWKHNHNSDFFPAWLNKKKFIHFFFHIQTQKLAQGKPCNTHRKSAKNTIYANGNLNDETCTFFTLFFFHAVKADVTIATQKEYAWKKQDIE